MTGIAARRITRVPSGVPRAHCVNALLTGWENSRPRVSENPNYGADDNDVVLGMYERSGYEHSDAPSQ